MFVKHAHVPHMPHSTPQDQQAGASPGTSGTPNMPHTRPRQESHPPGCTTHANPSGTPHDHSAQQHSPDAFQENNDDRLRMSETVSILESATTVHDVPALAFALHTAFEGDFVARNFITEQTLLAACQRLRELDASIGNTYH